MKKTVAISSRENLLNAIRDNNGRLESFIGSGTPNLNKLLDANRQLEKVINGPRAAAGQYGRLNSCSSLGDFRIFAEAINDAEEGGPSSAPVDHSSPLTSTPFSEGLSYDASFIRFSEEINSTVQGSYHSHHASFLATIEYALQTCGITHLIETLENIVSEDPGFLPDIIRAIRNDSDLSSRWASIESQLKDIGISDALGEVLTCKHLDFSNEPGSIVYQL